MDREQLLELAERCEKTTGPKRELDEAIRLLVERNIVVGLDLAGGYVPPSTPRYTESLDAAMQLVPEGWAWMAGCAPEARFFATLAPTDESGIEAEDIDTAAATPALALCAAALRARAADRAQPQG